jgi:hypothetical protein
MRQSSKLLILLIPGFLIFDMCIAQKKAWSGPGDEGPEERKPDLSIVSIAVVNPHVAKPATLTAARGAVPANPSTPTANPITQCTVTVRADSAADDQVTIDVTLPPGVKIQQAPANATVGAGILHILIGHLAPGQTATTQFTYSTPTVGAGLRNAVTASVKGSRPESNLNNNTRSAFPQ